MPEAFGSVGHPAVPFALGAPSLVLAAWFLARRIVRRLQAPIRGLAEPARMLSPSLPEERSSELATDMELRRLEQELNVALRRLERAIGRSPDSPATWRTG